MTPAVPDIPGSPFLLIPANNFLISAIARPGFRPLGHVLVQFMMVWHLKLCHGWGTQLKRWCNIWVDITCRQRRGLWAYQASRRSVCPWSRSSTCRLAWGRRARGTCHRSTNMRDKKSNSTRTKCTRKDRPENCNRYFELNNITHTITQPFLDILIRKPSWRNLKFFL